MLNVATAQLTAAAIQVTQTVQNQIPEVNQSDDITLLGIIVTWLIAVIGFAINYHQSKRNGITKPRIDWINQIRNIAADVVRYDYNDIEDEKRLSELNTQLLRNAYLLSLHLNIIGSFDGVIFDYLKEVVDARRQGYNSSTNEDFQYARRKLNLAMQIYLKAEWERVKWENKLVRRTNYTCKKEKKEILKLLNAFSEEDKDIEEILAKYKEELSREKAKTRKFTEFIEISVKL